MSLSVNIVSFDVPFPANYGGVIDVYYKLQWLHRMGVKVHLHCFSYGRQPAPELARLCEKVYYYPRKTGWLSNFSFSPYTVLSRKSDQLAENLLTNDFPIIFEVLHTCYLMRDKRFRNRKKIYRHSNIEHRYYYGLSRSEKNIVKNIYLKVEAARLWRFESVLDHADLILAVNEEDTDYFRRKFPSVRTEYLPSFHPNPEYSVKEGTGDYVLFHGNLSVSENYESVLWLATNVFPRVRSKVIVAGLNPPPFLIAELKKLPNILVRASPNEEEMVQLIRNAQVHVLYSAQDTGLKLKLLNVLFKGRFIVCNREMLAGTGLVHGRSLIVCADADGFVKAVNDCFHRQFGEPMENERRKQLEKFRNDRNVKTLVELIA